MKKHGCIFFAAVFVLGLLMVTANAQAAEAEAMASKIQLSGLIQVGGAWQDVDYEGAPPTKEEDKTDLCLTTVELRAEAEVNKWVKVAAVLLYQDFTFEDYETDVEMDEATVTIGNTEEYPLYCTAGKMYVPFGALLTSFPSAPHAPLIDAPLTLLFGETLEKALLVGVKHEGFSVSVYTFNGDVDEYGEDNNIETYGVDANYSMKEEGGLDLLIGASYISNVTDADGWEYAGELLDEMVEDYFGPGVDWGLKDYLPGAAGYVHVGFNGFFVDGEYMTALDDLELEIEGVGSANTELKPKVWNVEAGYNYDWGKNLQIVLKYAGSDEAEILDLPETRYGICLNQNIFEDVIISLGYLYDDYDEDETIDGKDQRDMVFAQLAIEF